MHRRHTGIRVPSQSGAAPYRRLLHPKLAVARTAAWATATMDYWGLGNLADDVSLIVAEFTSSAWKHGSPPVVVTLLLQESVLTIEVSDTGPAWRYSPGPARSARAATVSPPPLTSPSKSESTAGPGAQVWRT